MKLINTSSKNGKRWKCSNCFNKLSGRKYQSKGEVK